MARTMTCEELVGLITDYLEGALPRKVRKRFEKHLAICDGCQTYLEQMRRTIRATGTLTEESIPAPAREQLLEVFRDWSGG